MGNLFVSLISESDEKALDCEIACDYVKCANLVLGLCHRQECPEITYMATGFRPHSFPVGGMYMKGTGKLKKVKIYRSLLFSIVF